jgi:hypothetical protein
MVPIAFLSEAWWELRCIVAYIFLIVVTWEARYIAQIIVPHVNPSELRPFACRDKSGSQESRLGEQGNASEFNTHPPLHCARSIHGDVEAGTHDAQGDSSTKRADMHDDNL